jgi:DNA-binding XRE family transcriptional regulator
MAFSFPTSQGELIRAARGERTQAVFAVEVGVNRSCLSRYEKETLGAPTKLLNYCLRAVAQQLEDDGASEGGLRKALRHIHHAVDELEALRRDNDNR